MTSSLVPLNDRSLTDWTANALDTTLVCIGAKWCSNTQELMPVLEDLSTDYAGTVRFAMVDFDESPEFVAKHNVTAVPTLLLFRLSECEGSLDVACTLSPQARRAAIEEAIRRVM